MIIKMMNYKDELQILSDLANDGELATAKKPLPFDTLHGMFKEEDFVRFNNTCLVIDDVMSAEIRQAGDGFQLYFVLRTDDLSDAFGDNIGVAANNILELTGTVYLMNDKGTTVHSHYYVPPIPENIKTIKR